MTFIDYFILIVYMLGIFAVGFFLSSKNNSAEDMFAAGGESPWWTSGLSSFMTMFSAGTFVVWGGIAYEHGIVAVVINLCYGIAALAVGYYVAGKWKTLGVNTPAQFIELRFGAAAVQFYTWAMMVFRIVGVAVSLYALSVVLVAMMPLPEGNFLRDDATGNLSLTWAIIIFGSIVVIYTMAGGLWAVLMTDVLQFLVLNLAVLFIIPLIFSEAGGVSAFIERAPDGFFALTNDKYGWFFMVGWVLIHFFMIGAEWAFAQRFICVPNEKDARKSTYLFGALYLISPFFWLLPPLVYRVINPNADPQEAYILACKTVLPAGMLGLMVAAMFSATASMVSSQLNVFAGVLTEEFYQRLFKPKASESQLVRAGRVFTILLGVIVVVVSLAIPYLGGAEKVVVSITSLMVGPLLAPTIWGLFTKKINIKALWLTVSVSFVLGVIFKMGLAGDGFLVSEATQSLADWVNNNGKTVDLIIGIVVPVAVLISMDKSAKSVAEGWNKVENLKAKHKQEGELKEASDLPAKIVATCLLILALMMFGLVIYNEQDKGLLASFALVLLVIGAGIFSFLKIQKQKA